MENSLDAAESIGVLPLVSISVDEFTEEEFNEQRGMDNRDVVDEGLFKVCLTIRIALTVCQELLEGSSYPHPCWTLCKLLEDRSVRNVLCVR